MVVGGCGRLKRGFTVAFTFGKGEVGAKTGHEPRPPCLPFCQGICRDLV
jgi:hypothetical protein